MSKHERQHCVSHVDTMKITEVKHPRVVNMNIYKDEKVPSFSTCFLTDKLLIPDEKKSLA